MTISHIPNGFTSVTPYFICSDAEAFIKFVTDAFDAQNIDIHREGGVIRHFACKIFDSMIEGSQGSEQFGSNKLSIHLYVPDCDAVYAKAIATGGKSIYEVSDMPYGERSGGVEDSCGNSWWIATQQTDMYPNN